MHVKDETKLTINTSGKSCQKGAQKRRSEIKIRFGAEGVFDMDTQFALLLSTRLWRSVNQLVGVGRPYDICTEKKDLAFAPKKKRIFHFRLLYFTLSTSFMASCTLLKL